MGIRRLTGLLGDMSDRVERFAFLNARGMFVHISESAGHTGRKIFVTEATDVNQATVHASKDLSKQFMNLTPRHALELDALVAVPVTVSRAVTVG